MITQREIVLQNVKKKADVRIGRYDAFWEDTLRNWRTQGLDEQMEKEGKTRPNGQAVDSNEISDFFGFDIRCIHFDNSMRFTPKILEETDDYRIIEDRCGYTVKVFKHVSRTMQVISCKTTTDSEWRRYRRRLEIDFDTPARVDTETFFLRTTPVPTWETVKKKVDCLRKTDKFLLLTGYGPYEAMWRHHGFEQTLMDFAMQPKWVEQMLGQHTELTIAIIKKALDCGIRPDGIFIVEDLGYQKSTLISPDMFKKMVYPCHKRLGEFFHENELPFFLHSCGKIQSFIPMWIQAGVDVLQPLEAKADQDIRKLCEQYGHHLVFMGNIDVRAMNGPDYELEKEIASKLEAAKKTGGYIYHSDHSIPPEVSFDQYKRVMNLVKKYGEYNACIYGD